MDLTSLLSYASSIATVQNVLVIAGASLLVWMLFSYSLDMSRYPRGPLPLPFIGSILQVLWCGDIIEFLMTCWKKYGDIFTIKIGSKVFVVINGYETINDALVKKSESFSEHNNFHDVGNFGPERIGLMFAPYPIWKKHRKLVLKVFKEQGFVKNGLEEKVCLEAAKVLPVISAADQGPFSLDEILLKAVANVISSFVFGSRFDYDDPEYASLLKRNQHFFTVGRRMAMVELFPFLAHLPWDFLEVKYTKMISAEHIATAERKMTEHEATLDEANPASYIDTYLVEIQKAKARENHEESPPEYFNRIRCGVSITELFGAGSETTSTALNWAFLMCIMHPEMQQRVHDEIDYAIGATRPPTVSDRQKTTYIDAFLTEVLRFSNVVSLALPHRVIHDVTLNGHFIPKDTEIVVNLHSVLHDKRRFKTPSLFLPERFLNSRKEVVNKESFIPFGIGRRACLGEELAQIELYIFFTTMMQHFSFAAPPGAKLSDKGVLGLTRTPLPYKVIATPRQSASPNKVT